MIYQKNQISIKETVGVHTNELHQFILDELKNDYLNEADAKKTSNEVMVLIDSATMLSQI